jgi:hypothetical protein
VELPAEVTHYYLAGRRPFMSLSDLDEIGRSAVLAEMADLRRAGTQHRPFGARYMELRELTEGRLRELFEAAGGKPERKNPHYFVLGTSEWYERLAESMSAARAKAVRREALQPSGPPSACRGLWRAESCR